MAIDTSKLVSERNRIASNIASSYSVAEELGATLPENRNSDNLPDTLRTIPQGTPGSAPNSVPMKEVNFYDYDGTRLYSYTIAEAAALTELPPLPTQEGLICQGWNWTLEDIKAMDRAVDVGATYITDDGKTRIHITLLEGRTSPVLGCCPNGTVTVDWGDGTEPDILTATLPEGYVTVTPTAEWTPTHAYAAPGDYVITLTVDGTLEFYGVASDGQYSGILRHKGGSDGRNTSYQNAVKRIEIGSGVTSIGDDAFHACYNISTITIPNSVTSIGDNAFMNCYSLSTIIIPNGVTSIGEYAFTSGYRLSTVSIPNSVTTIGNSAFQSCTVISTITIPNSVTSIGEYAFHTCYSLSTIIIPNGVTSIASGAFTSGFRLSTVFIPNSVTTIGDNAFHTCYNISTITIPNGVTSIGYGAFQNCRGLLKVVIPNSVVYIETNAFAYCYAVPYYDFSHHTVVPTLANKKAFNGITDECEIRVPAALADEWKAATNWAEYADHIVGV